jgi:acetyl-CoA synthetase
VWRPDAELLRSSNVARFMTEHGIATFADLVQRSIDEPEWFWDATVRFLDLRFTTPYSEVLDLTDGVPFAKWFTGGTLNLAATCVDMRADDPATAELPRSSGKAKKARSAPGRGPSCGPQ